MEEKMPVVTVDWENAHRHGDIWISQHRLRHRIFVERLGWNLPTHRGLEYDAFDTPAAKYLVWVDGDREARGITRLVPTTVPYMIEKVWPDWPCTPLPHSDQVWEATRFGCDHRLPRRERRRVVLELIAGCQRFGIANGISALLAVMPIWIFERILVPAGCRLTMLAPARPIDGDVVGVAEVEVSLGVLARVDAKLQHAVTGGNDASSRCLSIA
jgi:N-acyl-L-homoserine lactone synthetase